jgi:hypothetical protein
LRLRVFDAIFLVVVFFMVSPLRGRCGPSVANSLVT